MTEPLKIQGGPIGPKPGYPLTMLHIRGTDMTEQACRFEKSVTPVKGLDVCVAHKSHAVLICDLGLAALRAELAEQGAEYKLLKGAFNGLEKENIRLALDRADQARVMAGLSEVLEDIASGELGINVAIKHAKKALFPTMEPKEAKEA